MWVWSLGWEDLLEKDMVIHSSILAGEFHGQRSLARYIVHGVEKSQTGLSDWRKANSIPITSHSSPFPPNLWQPLIHLFVLVLCLFWIFHINGVIQHVAFCDLLLACFPGSSMLKHVPVCHSFLWLDNVTLYIFIHSLVDGHLPCFDY